MAQKKSPIKVNIEIIEKLKTSIYDTFKSGDYLGSAIIQFQMIDWLLRLNILVLIYPPCSKSVVKRVLEKEDRFNRLVNYFDLVKPDNGISKRLLDFNNRRNRIIHKLFYAHPSFDSLEREIKSFSKEGIELEKNLKGFLDNFLSKV